MGHLVRLSYPEAPSGSWAIQQHGVASPGTAYSDWECQTVKTDRALNSSGRTTFYVSESVDVIVYNSSSVAVDAFTEGVRGELVGVNSPSWTGTLPNGSQGLGGDLSLTEMIAAMRASFGANDGYVRETGQASDQLLKDALANIRSANFPYFNVKSAPYNATGNGVTDDSSAIQSAVTACAAAGGGVVYFPRGTYLCSTGITITNSRVSVLGDGAASIVQYTGVSGTKAFTFTGIGFQASNSISQIKVYASGTGGLIENSNNPGFRIDRCYLATAVSGAGVVSSNVNLYVTFNYIDVPLTSAVGRGIIENITSVAGNAVVAIGNVASTQLALPDAALVTAPSSANTAMIIAVGNIAQSNAYIIGVNTTNAAGQYIAIGNAGAPIKVYATGAAGTYIEAGNTGNVIFDGTTTSPNVVSTYSMTRSVDRGSVAATLSPASASRDEYCDVTATPITVSAPALASWDGHTLKLRIRNTTGGAVTLNWNAAYLGTGVMGTIAAGATRVVEFTRKNSGTTPGWRYSGHDDTT